MKYGTLRGGWILQHLYNMQRGLLVALHVSAGWLVKLTHAESQTFVPTLSSYGGWLCDITGYMDLSHALCRFSWNLSQASLFWAPFFMFHMNLQEYYKGLNNWNRFVGYFITMPCQFVWQPIIHKDYECRGVTMCVWVPAQAYTPLYS